MPLNDQGHKIAVDVRCAPRVVILYNSNTNANQFLLMATLRVCHPQKLPFVSRQFTI